MLAKYVTLFLLYFFHYHLVPLYPHPPCIYHTVVHVHESFFLSAPPLYPLNSPLPLAIILLSESLNHLLTLL